MNLNGWVEDVPLNGWVKCSMLAKDLVIGKPSLSSVALSLFDNKAGVDQPVPSFSVRASESQKAIQP